MPKEYTRFAVFSLLGAAGAVVWMGVWMGGAPGWVGVLATALGGAGVWVAWSGLGRAGASVSSLSGSLRRLAEAPPGWSPATEGREAEELEAVVAASLTTGAERARALLAMLDAMDEPVVACAEDLEVVAANRRAVALLAPGSSRPLVGEPLDQVLTDARAVGAASSAVRGEGARVKARLLSGEGTRIVEIAAEPVAGGPFGTDRPPAVVLTLRDVTEQATAMRLKTDFVANASHELRTPLASIRTAAETLMSLGEDGAPMRARLVSMIASNAERLEELSSDLLDLSRLESPETECELTEVDLLATASELAEMFQDACAQRRIELAFELPEAFGSFRTDAKLIRLVLRNLIDNAIKFAYEETVVRVRGRVLDGPPDAAGRVGARIEVIDRGIGIPLAQQQRVFERFFQVDEARTGPVRRRGTGLGLAIVKHALRALHGTIRVESVWQRGTTMRVELPGCVTPEKAGGAGG
jgi:two-component system, OmpR family, phosphate regulon sensor histidine kinase PhoR